MNQIIEINDDNMNQIEDIIHYFLMNNMNLKNDYYDEISRLSDIFHLENNDHYLLNQIKK